MNNQEAINSLKNIIEYWTCRPTEVEAAKLAISALEAQQADRWVPVNPNVEESYPKSFTEVIFTDGNYIFIGCCDPDYKWSSTNQEDSMQIEYVTAWRPLPIPYKEVQP